MKIYLSKSDNPYENLAFEEALLRYQKSDEDILFIYQNASSIIIGRNQNVYEEINQDFIEKKGIHIARRLSGGGAVYQDLGNICFSFISNQDGRRETTYQYFLKPVIGFLKSLGLDAKFKGRNDVVIGENEKISGNAQYIWQKRIMHHGTILFDTDLTILSKSLKVDPHKIQSKGIKSVSQRVTNINKLIKSSWTARTFIIHFINFFLTDKNNRMFEPSQVVRKKAKKLLIRYSSWEWNYGRSPKFSISNKKHYLAGTINVMLNVEKGNIKNIAFYGDFLSKKNPDKVIKSLTGIKFNSSAVQKALSNFGSDYFGKITKKQILNCIMGK